MAPEAAATLPTADEKAGRDWVAGGSGFVWTPIRQQAVELVWQDQMTDEEIARSLGICRRTLGNWKASAAFQAQIERRADEFWRRETRLMQRRIRESYG